MINITAADVNKLRQMTGAGMMDCKKALQESEGDFEKAIGEFLQSAELDETNWPALNNAGSIYLNTLKNPAKAAAMFEKAFVISRNLQIARNLDLARRIAENGVKGKKR